MEKTFFSTKIKLLLEIKFLVEAELFVEMTV